MKHTAFVLALLLTMALMVAGCGSDEIPSYVEGDLDLEDLPVTERQDYSHRVEGDVIVTTAHVTLKNLGAEVESSVDFTGMVSQGEVRVLEARSEGEPLPFQVHQDDHGKLTVTVELGRELMPGDEAEVTLTYEMEGAISSVGGTFTARALQLSPAWRKLPTYPSNYEFHIPAGKVFRDSFPPKTQVSDDNAVSYTTYAHQANFRIEYGDTEKTVTTSLTIYVFFFVVAILSFLGIWKLRHSS